jgi:pyruvate,orthophosphate dikinase
VRLEVMIPLVGFKSELDFLAARIANVAAEIARERGHAPAYQVGTMIELPRAALRAAEIAETAEFFSFGTNDLTQTTLGLSRDDAGNFLQEYLARGIIERDPFVSIDTPGVGELVSIAAERGRKTRKNLKLGICGEHGGDPDRYVRKISEDTTKYYVFRFRDETFRILSPAFAGDSQCAAVDGSEPRC